MIPNQWYAVLESREIKRGEVLGATRMGMKLAFWRTSDNSLYCIKDQCIHRGAALSKGDVIHHHLQCPFHGFEYDYTGKVKIIPAIGRNSKVAEHFRQDTFTVQEIGGLVFLWWGESEIDLKNLPTIPMFEELADKNFRYNTITDHWAVHYSLAIENQLDVVHLPFVHKTTIGRGNRTVILGPGVELINENGINELQVWVRNEKDIGQDSIQKKIPRINKAMLYFRFPNIWMNRISDNTRIFVAFSPIDDMNTLMYVRFYQKGGLPFFRSLFGKFGALGNRIILRQDKKVVITQNPKKSSYPIVEQKLIHGDRPIIEYRKLRSELKARIKSS